MTTRVFKLQPDMGGGCLPPAEATAPQSDAAKKILEAVGVSFAEGASATFDSKRNLLTVTNTSRELGLVASYLDTFEQTPAKAIACTVTVIEAPGELIREASAAASHTPSVEKQLTRLLDLARKPGSNVHVVGDAFLETRSGTRASTEAVCEHNYASGLELDSKSRASVVHEMRQIGLRFEYEPLLGADGRTIESTLAIELQPAPPTERQVNVSEPKTGHVAEFPVTEISNAKFTTGITSTTGSVKLIGITKPVGTEKQNADVLWAAFLTTTVRQVKSQGFSHSAATRDIQPHAGMCIAAFNVPDGSIESSIEKPSSLQRWLETNGVKPVPEATAKHINGVLHVINTADNIGRIADLIAKHLDQSPKTVGFTLHTFQVPASLLRDLTRQTITSADDTAMLNAVEAAAARGEASHVNSVFLETRGGTRSRLESACEHFYLSKFGTTAKGKPDLAFEMRPAGSVFEIEPTLGSDGYTVDLVLSHELHPAAPVTRRERFRDPASNKPFDMPVVDFHTAKMVTGISMARNGTKLISLNRPTGRGDPDVLWATFLKCDVVAQVMHSKPASPKRDTKVQPVLDPQAWNTRMFRVPPDYLASGLEVPPPAPGATGELVVRRTAKMVLEAQGISFPEGATASFNPATSMLFVKNTNENLALVETFVKSLLKEAPKLGAFNVHVIQGPGPLLRRLTAQAAGKNDHGAELDELLAAAKAGTVQHLNTARIETKSGTRATSQQASEHIAFTGVSLNDKDEPVFEQETREVGFRVEVEPVVYADSRMVEITLESEFHTAPFFEHREHVIDTQGRRLEFPLTDYHVARLSTGITMSDGTTRLLSLHKPTGRPEFEKEDILQVMFLTFDIL